MRVCYFKKGGKPVIVIPATVLELHLNPQKR